MDTLTPHLAVFISLSGAGGVERMVMNLVREFSRYPIKIDLLTLKAKSEHFVDIPSSVRIIPLKSKSSVTCIPELKNYLREKQPNAMLVAKDRAGRAALKARKLAGIDTRIVIRLGTNLSSAITKRSVLNRRFRLRRIRKTYPLADAIIAVSNGVAFDTQKLSRYPLKKIQVIRNPVITDRMKQQAEEPVPHAWFRDDTPIVMGAGRMTDQKDFQTLISAFGKLSNQLPARLIILGEGKERPELETHIKDLKLQDRVLLPGFQSNLYAWLARADLFVLSSRWEGSPNVLTEALALGIPSVATRCPSGPDEILQNGKIGPLVEIGDADGLAAAMHKTLTSPIEKTLLQAAVAEYTAAVSAQHYLKALNIDASPN